MINELLNIMCPRRGHFRFESGHHGDLWLTLDGALFRRPARLRPMVDQLAQALSCHDIDAVCGPMLGGAFLAALVADRLDVDFLYAERIAEHTDRPLFPVTYRLPTGAREAVNGKSIAIVDDVINAGSAVRAAYADSLECGARPVAIAALLVLGSGTSDFAAQQGLTLHCTARLPNNLWTPEQCPLCAKGEPLDDPTNK